MHAILPEAGNRRRVETAFGALLLGMLMAQLDTNVVVAALPSIAHDLHAGQSVAGVTAVYLLVVTVATPLHGRLGDVLGRRWTFPASVALFALGSVACAAAPSMPALIAARAVQGLGGSGLIVSAVAGLAEMFDQGALIRRQGWSVGLFALSSIAGPPLGGLLAAGPGWRWIFLLNVPLSLLAVVLGTWGLPARSLPRPPLRLDAAGAALITVGGGCVVALGSGPAPAAHPGLVLALLGAALLAGVAFAAVERRAADPLVPPRLLRDRVLGRTVATTLAGGAVFGTITFVPLLIAGAVSTGPAAIGALLLPMTAGQLAMTSSFAVLARRRGTPAGWGRLGLAMGVAGMLLLAAAPSVPGPARGVALVAGLALAGAAFGLTLQAFTLVAQAHAPRDAIGTTMATLSFVRQLGASVGIAAFGWLSAVVAGGPWRLAAVFLGGAVLTALALVVAPRPGRAGRP